MKKFLKDKIRRVRKTDEEAPSRITNETVAEHRERILAGGRKFKYPLQYQKHKLVINSVLIGVATLVVLVLIIWQQLYLAQNTSKFIYRVTQLFPAPVASVEGEWVRYSDYLRRYRSAIHALQNQNQISLNSEAGKRQSEFIKRQELNKAERDTFVRKLAREQGIKVTDKQVNDFIMKDIDAKSVSLESYERNVLNAYFDWTLDDYRDIVRTDLLRREVSFAIDDAAKDKIDSIKKRVKSSNFAEIARKESDDTATKAGGGRVGSLPLNNQDPNGLIAVAQKLRKNQVSDVIKGTDGYYIIMLLNKTERAVEYAQIKVSLTEFDKRFAALDEQGKIEEFIKVEDQERS